MAGRPKGQPKTGGRVAGSKNKATVELRAEAQKYTKEALRTLVEIMRKPLAAEQARIGAAKEILDRGYGKAPQAVTGGDSGPIQVVVSLSDERL